MSTFCLSDMSVPSRRRLWSLGEVVEQILDAPEMLLGRADMCDATFRLRCNDDGLFLLQH